jgi:hypothetical protein
MQRVHAELVFKSKNPAWCQFLHLPTPNLPYWWHARSAHTLRTPCHYIDQAYGPGGARSIVAESLLIKHQPLIVSRSRQRVPNLRTAEQILMSVFALLMRPVRLAKSAVIIKPSTILEFHQALKDRKNRLLFSRKRRGRPGRPPMRNTLSWTVPYSCGCVISNSPLTRRHRQIADGIRQGLKAEETGE